MPFKNKEDRRKYERMRRRIVRYALTRVPGLPNPAERLSQPADSLPSSDASPLLSNEPSIVEMGQALATVINQVHASDQDTLARARCVGYLTSVLIRARELGDLEKRIDQLERKIRNEYVDGDKTAFNARLHLQDPRLQDESR